MLAHTETSWRSRSICSHPNERCSACSLVFWVADEELELGLDGIRPQRGGRLHSGEQTAKLAPTLRYFLSLIPDPNCIQVKYDAHINPDTVAVAGEATSKIFLQVGSWRQQKVVAWEVRGRRKLGPPRRHKEVPWGGWGVALQQPAAANRAR